MNKKTRIILVILLALLLLSYLLLKFNAPHEKTRRVFRLDPNKVDRIDIWNSEETLHLNLIDGIWTIAEPFVWEADSTKVAAFFEEVLNAEYATTSMSEGPDSAKRYELQDDQALHVQVYAGRKSEHLLFSNLGNPWDYFRFANENQVYQVKSKIAQLYQPEQVNWRSPLILQYWEEDLASIRCKYADQDFSLSRDGSEWTYTDAQQSFPIAFDNFGLVKIISILQNMRASIFADGRDSAFQQAFKEPLCEVWITTVKAETRKLSFAEVDNERHMLMVDDDPAVLFQVSYDTVFRFMRDAGIFRRGVI